MDIKTEDLVRSDRYRLAGLEIKDPIQGLRRKNNYKLIRVENPDTKLLLKRQVNKRGLKGPTRGIIKPT